MNWSFSGHISFLHLNLGNSVGTGLGQSAFRASPPLPAGAWGLVASVAAWGQSESAEWRSSAVRKGAAEQKTLKPSAVLCPRSGFRHEPRPRSLGLVSEGPEPCICSVRVLSRALCRGCRLGRGSPRPHLGARVSATARGGSCQNVVERGLRRPPGLWGVRPSAAGTRWLSCSGISFFFLPGFTFLKGDLNAFVAFNNEIIQKDTGFSQHAWQPQKACGPSSVAFSAATAGNQHPC